MYEALPDNEQDPTVPEPEARTPVSPPMDGMASARVDPAEPFSPGERSAFLEKPEDFVHGFTLERGGRNGIAGTAERIGSAVGSAQRQVRRGLELVRRPASQIGAASSAAAADAADRATQIAHEGVDRASRAIEDIKIEISESRRQAARRLDQWSEQAGERFQQLRYEARRALSHSRVRVQETADAYPLQTIAAVAGVCFVLGAVLRLRRSHRG